MISFDKVTFSFGARQILADFSLTCLQHTPTALLGPSGCGKTTIIRLACGLLEPNAGEISANGQRIRLGDVRGVLFQDDTLLPWLNAVGNAWFPAALDKGRAMPKRLKALFAAFGLTGAEKLLPHELSAGMKKRVELARALCADGAYLIGDEPFSALDFNQRLILWNYWRLEVTTRGRTALLVTHDVDEAISISDRILLLTADAPTKITLSVDRKNGHFPESFRAEALRAILSESIAR
jgi:NitT/TauT family transport system ATP-binding protein